MKWANHYFLLDSQAKKKEFLSYLKARFYTYYNKVIALF